MKYLKTLLFTLFIGHFFAQIDYKKVDFRSPLDIPLVLAANFGELRTNHFHTGIDFKTNRRTGYKIYAIEDGYVSRIKVSPWGYGKVVYIDHYNGLTSVYAHCENFEGEINDLVNKRQRNDENFAFDYSPAKDSIKVKKGQVIAFSGNTGGSTAPHLHFEIRETASEDALNPLLFDFPIEDTKKPKIRSVKLYSVTKEGYRIPGKSLHRNTYSQGVNYSVKGNKIVLPADFAQQSGGVGIAFDAIDQLNAAENICGIHRSFLMVDGDTMFSQDMTRISFFTNRQINTHKDYEEFHQRRKHYHKSFRTCHNQLPIYRKQKNQGIIRVEPGKEYIIKYTCHDSYGNSSSLRFELKIQPGKQPIEQVLYPGKKKLYPDTPFMSIDSTHYLFFPQLLLYEPTPLILENTQQSIHFGNNKIPLNGTFDLMLPLLPDYPPAKQYVQRKESNVRITAIAGKAKDGWISISSKEFGVFNVAIDTVAPHITNYNFQEGANVSGKTLKWRISDEETYLADYDIFIDDTWYLLEWEPKQRIFYFTTPKSLSGKKKLTIRAIDQCGNQREISYSLNF